MSKVLTKDGKVLLANGEAILGEEGSGGADIFVIDCEDIEFTETQTGSNVFVADSSGASMIYDKLYNQYEDRKAIVFIYLNGFSQVSTTIFEDYVNDEFIYSAGFYFQKEDDGKNYICYLKSTPDSTTLTYIEAGQGSRDYGKIVISDEQISAFSEDGSFLINMTQEQIDVLNDISQLDILVEFPWDLFGDYNQFWCKKECVSDPDTEKPEVAGFSYNSPAWTGGLFYPVCFSVVWNGGKRYIFHLSPFVTSDITLYDLTAEQPYSLVEFIHWAEDRIMELEEEVAALKQEVSGVNELVGSGEIE